ncbi:MAG: histidine triad nucleotide-binding protein [Chloroflexota bacterium]|jgi:histidine triad (HIT) family protein
MYDCVFCQIVAGESPAAILFADESVTAFNDIHPIAPVHILVVPNDHISGLDEVDESHQTLIGHMIVVAKNLANSNSLSETGYRLVINTGADAGQSIFHLHLHLIGGRRMPFRFQ